MGFQRTNKGWFRAGHDPRRVAFPRGHGAFQRTSASGFRAALKRATDVERQLLREIGPGATVKQREHIKNIGDIRSMIEAMRAAARDGRAVKPAALTALIEAERRALELL